ncbi:MAG: hypothetical protein NC203_06935 [Firmicutes bacterium]|nr:hypothetical protein [[Eubacterium] siraeum]MCM1488083.1 hypothetical protein [Bacillota bacterium]
MYGGSITGNSVEGSTGGGIYCFYKVSLTLDGNVNVSGNTGADGYYESDLYIGSSSVTLTIGENFDLNSKVGLHTYSNPNCNTVKAIAKNVSKDVSGCFFYDNHHDTYYLTYDDNTLNLRKYHSLTATEEKPATCTEDGNIAYWQCSSCKKYFSDSAAATETTLDKTVAAAAGHSYSDTWSKDISQHWQTCTKCGAAGTKTAHTWNSGEVTKDAACIATGIMKYTCTTCGQTKTASIAATGHNLTATAAKAATCTEDGNIAYWYCSKCNSYFSNSAATVLTTLAATKIAALGHSYSTAWSKDDTQHWHKCIRCDAVNGTAVHSWGSGAITTAATCTTKGVRTYTCTCGQTKTEDIAAIGHTEVTDAAKTPTCTETGLTAGSHCSVCKAVITAQTTVAATGHSWDSGTVTKEPTEASEGVKTFTCENCKETKTETIPKLDHVHSLTHHEKVNADCVNTGTVEYWSCSSCGKNYVDEAATDQLADLTIPAKGHTEVADAAVAPTCTVDGKTEGSHCSVCKTVLTAQESITAKGHTWDNGVVTKAPTASAEGVKTYTCTVCGETKTEKIPTTGGTGTPNTPTNPDTPDDPSDNKNGNIITEVEPGENVPPTELKTPKDELIDAVLTPEEKVQIEDGVDIKIILKVEDGTAKVPAEDKTNVEQAIGEMNDYKLGQYLDVELLKIIGGTQENIHETNSEITVTFEIPAALRGKQSYSVIRIHNGETTVLTDEDSDVNTVTIKTDKFSTYALAYSETAPDDDNPADDTPTVPNGSTDDNSDTTSDGGEPTSSDTSETSSDDSEPTESGTSDTSSDNSEPVNNSTSDNTSSGENSDDNSGNPATGIAVSCLPMAMAVIALTIAATRKKK